MRRFFVTFIAFVILFFIIYSATWLYNSNAVKENTEIAILALTKDLGGKKSDFLYSDTTISGFPFYYTVQINKPRFILNDRELSVDLSSEEPLIIKSDILISNYKATLPKSIKVKDGESVEENYVVQYNIPPVITVESQTDNLFEKILSKLRSVEDQPMFQFKQAIYSDKGYKYLNPLTQDILASADSSNIIIDLAANNKYNLKADLKNQYFSRLDNIAQDIEGSNKLDLKADILYSYKSGDEITFNDFNLNTDAFSVKINGHAASSNIEAFPYGNLEIKVSNYQNFIDFQASLMNDIVKSSGFQIFNIKDKQISQFKEFILKVANETTNNNKDVVVGLKREEGQAINIGEYSFIEAVHLYKGGTIEKVTTPASNDFIAEGHDHE
jgi:hypothetical protein